MDSKVYIVTCEDYSQAGEKLAELLARMGGMEKYAKEGERLLLKVNLLQPSPPEKAISTHPSVAAAVAGLVKAQGAAPLIGDSPGAGYKYTPAGLKHLYEKCGMIEAAETSGALLNYDTSSKAVSFPAGKLIKHMEVLSPVVDCDGVLNLCKLKTHMFMSMTGAVKNNFGIIPGLSKVGFHAKFQDKAFFADMLLDLAAFVSPRLSIMDAVVGLEGDGPGAAGAPRHVGLLLASENPLALDVAAGEIIGLPRAQNPVLLAAERRGLFPTRVEELELVGADLDKVRIKEFRFPSNMWGGSLGRGNWWQRPAAGIVKAALTQTPRVVTKQCVGCGICQKSCPAKAITICPNVPQKAKIDVRRCIRCYCCHELCPKKAVELHRTPLARLFP